MNAITYFKLNSPYEGDVTKNCALTGSEVDNNFYTLEGRDIKSVEVNNGKVVVNLMNGDTLTTDNITENCIKELTIDFDEVNGILTITQNGVVQTIEGFATNYTVGEAISVDGSLIGNGQVKMPIGVSPVAKTGQYRPVQRIIDTLNGEKLPSKHSVYPGDRFLTIENVNDFGFLYNYEGLKKIACKLRETGSQWRIPTKQDWDDMLNAIEPCQDFANHGDSRSNKFLGKFAGKFLKSKEYWKNDDSNSCDGCLDNDTCFDYSDSTCSEECACGRHITCHPDYCGEYGTCHHRHKKNNNGIDKFGFRALPAGYSNEARDFMYFKERAYFWTASNHECRDAYVKILTYNKSSVLQDVMASDNYMSVRLVKDYNGINFNEREEILGGTYSTVLMPSVQHGRAIWTSVNLALSDCGCDCSCSCSYVLPNDGQGMVYKKRYFINEWNGKEWLKKELADGESVVVINEVVTTGQTQDDNHCPCHDETDNNTYVANYKEYRVVNEELVDVAKLTYDDVMDYVQPKFFELENSIENLEERLQAEITRSTTKDEEIESNISQINEHVEEIQETVENFENQVNGLNERITETETKLEQEIADREEKDTEIEDKIDELEEKNEELEEVLTEVEATLETLDGKTLVSDGTVFDANTGVLTLKSKDGSNDIEVQFNFNFGTF